MSEFCLIWNRNTELTCHPCYFYLNVRIHNRTGGKCGEAPTCQERVGLWCSQQKSQGAYDPVGWRGRWPQPQRATLSPYFSLCRLDHDQSKSTGGEKKKHWQGDVWMCWGSTFNQKCSFPSNDGAIMCYISSHTFHLGPTAWSHYKQCLVGCMVLICCPTPSFWSCPTLSATTGKSSSRTGLLEAGLLPGPHTRHSQVARQNKATNYYHGKKFSHNIKRLLRIQLHIAGTRLHTWGLAAAGN